MDTLALVWHYSWQMLCGTVFFVLVALLAVGLHYFVTLLEYWGLPWYITKPIFTIELLLFVGDLCVFIFYIIIENSKMIQEIQESR